MMLQFVWFGLGQVVAALFLFYARSQGPHKEMYILRTGLIIAAVIYVGFAALWGNSGWVLIEITGIAVYGLFAVLALRHSAVWLAIGWAAHSLWDVLLHLFGQGHAIAPEWYVIACLSFDLLVAGYILTRFTEWKQMGSPTRVGENLT